MASLAQQAEILKLARLLGTAPETLAFLDKLDVGALRQLREHSTASLYDADHHLFHRIASASKLLPAGVTALIAEKALGSFLCARIAGLLPAGRAVDIARRLHSGFLADVCLDIDPRHVRDLIAGIPVDLIVEVAVELAGRREYITMARFVDCLPEQAMRAILDALGDDAALLRIGFFVEDPAALSDVIRMLPETRLRNMIVCAIDGEDELWPEALGLINGIAEPQRRHMASIASRLDDALLARMVRRTQDQALWPSLLPLVTAMHAADQERLARISAIDDDAVLESMIRAADRCELWPQLLPLVAHMDSAVQSRATRVAQRLGPRAAKRLTAAPRRLGGTAAAGLNELADDICG